MAKPKQRKSIVSGAMSDNNRLPTSEENIKAAAELTEKQVQATEQAKEISKIENAANKSNKVGRPKATHDRKRTSVIVAPELWQDFKILALRKGKNVSDLLELAIRDAMKKYDK